MADDRAVPRHGVVLVGRRVAAEFEVLEVELRFRVDRLTDQLQSVELSRRYNVAATVTFTEAYGAMMRNSDGRQITVTLPYKATERISTQRTVMRRRAFLSADRKSCRSMFTVRNASVSWREP